MILSTVFFSMLMKQSEKNLINEKFEEKKLEVAMMANHVDKFIARDNDWEQEHDYYQQSLVYDMDALDSANMTYAVVYNYALEPLSKQVNYQGGFNPMVYPNFIKAVHENEMGDMIFPFTPSNGPARDVYLHYRWIPTGPQYNNRFLVVVAMSKYTIVTQTEGWYKTGSVALIVVTSILNIAMIAVIGWLVEQRKKC